MGKWSELKAAEKARVIQFAIRQGVSDIQTIRDTFNNIYAQGGKIHIDPSKKGTFTAAASKHGKSVQAFASQVLAHKENYSPAMVKKANFARNFGGHRHDDGGYNWLPDFAYNPSIQSHSGRQLVQSVLQDENIQRAVQQKALQRQEEIEAQRKAVSEIYNGMPNPGAGYVSGTDPLLQAIVDMTPAGDAEMATEAASELRNGNLKEAGLLGAALLLPNIFNKGIKEWRAAKNLSKVADKTPIDPTQRIELLLNNYLDEKRLAHRSASTESLKDWAESIQLGGDSKAMYDMLVNSGVDVSKLKSTDLHYLIRIRQQQLATQMPTRYINNNTYDRNNPIMHLYEPNNTQPIGKLEYGYINGQHKGFNYEYGLEPAMIENLSNGTAKGVSRDLYDAAIKVAQDNGYPGVISGKLLLSPEATTHIWDLYYPDRRLLSMRGTHKYKTGDLSGQPIVMLEKPSKEVLPTKSFVFSPDIVDENGIMHIIPNGDIYHSTGGPLYPFSFSKQPLPPVRH